MLAFLLGLFRLVFLLGEAHGGIALENLALRQQLSIYRRKPKRPRLLGRDRWFWIALSGVWKDWPRALVVVHPDMVVRWQRERFRRYWSRLSRRRGTIGRPPIRPSDSHADSKLSGSEPVVARTTNSRRVTQAGHRGVRANRIARPANGQATAVADLENIPAESPRGHRCH